MENFNALLTLSELKTLYSKKPVGICPLYKGSIGGTKRNEAAGNPVTIPKYEQLEKLAIEFSPKQAGTGDPSPENVRAITGWDSVKVTVSDKEESHDYDVTLPETIYGGTVDAVTGVGYNTYIFKELAISDMDNSEVFPGWRGQAWITQAIPGEITDNTLAELGAVGLINIFPSTRIRCTSYNTLYFTPGNDFFPGLTQSQIKEQYPELKLQLCLKLITPQPFETSKISIASLGSENTIFTNGENLDIIYKVSSFWG